MALTVSSRLMFFCGLPEERGGHLDPSLLMHSYLSLMSSIDRGDMPLLGTTSIDEMARQNE